MKRIKKIEEESTIKANEIEFGECFRRPRGSNIYIRANFRTCNGISTDKYVYGMSLENGNMYRWRQDEDVHPVQAVWSTKYEG